MIEYFTIFQSSYYTNSDPMRNPFFDFQTLQMKLKHNQALLGLRDLFLTYFAVAATMKKGFLRNFTKFLRTPFLYYTSGRLLVNLLLSADMML